MEDNIPQIQVEAEYEFEFFEHSIHVVKSTNGNLYVPLISLCKIFSLNELKESQRIKRHSLLHTKMVQASVVGLPKLRCLQLGFIATWLLNLPLDSVEDQEDCAELTLFQKNASQILEEAFCAGRLTNEALLADLLEYDSLLGKVYKESLAVLGLARQQLLTEGDSEIFYQQHGKS